MNDIHGRVALEFCRYSTNVHHEKFTKILRREYGHMTDMHTAADKAAKVWMEKCRERETEIDGLKADLAKARAALDETGEEHEQE